MGMERGHLFPHIRLGSPFLLEWLHTNHYIKVAYLQKVFLFGFILQTRSKELQSESSFENEKKKNPKKNKQ